MNTFDHQSLTHVLFVCLVFSKIRVMELSLCQFEDPTFFFTDPDPTLNRNEEKIYLYFW